MIKNLIPSVFVLTILTSYNQIKNTEKYKSLIDSTKIENSNSTPSDPLNEYKLFVSKLNTLDVKTVTLAAQKFQELLKNEDVDTRDKAFFVFNSHYEKLHRIINELHEKDTTNFDPLIMVEASRKKQSIPKKLQDYIDKLKNNGFEISSTEGMSFIKQDRDFIAKWFYPYVSATMKEYLVQLNKENKEGFAEDAGLLLDPKHFVDRIIWWENFCEKNQDFILINKAKERKEIFLTVILEGMDNTPVLSYESKSLDNYYKTAYSYIQDYFPNSETNRIANPYYRALLKKDYAKAKALLSEYRAKGYIIVDELEFQIFIGSSLEMNKIDVAPSWADEEELLCTDCYLYNGSFVDLENNPDLIGIINNNDQLYIIIDNIPQFLDHVSNKKIGIDKYENRYKKNNLEIITILERVTASGRQVGLLKMFLDKKEIQYKEICAIGFMNN